jgi:hypothetical protein
MSTRMSGCARSFIIHNVYFVISAALILSLICAIQNGPKNDAMATAIGAAETNKRPVQSINKKGTFFVSDAGRSHGGFEFTSSYKANFEVKNGKGVLKLTQEIGLGDPLKRHYHIITDLQLRPNRISLNIDNHPVKLVLVKKDRIWNHQFDNNYIAAWGGDAPKNEIKGSISPSIFPGLEPFWYVELRIPRH